MPNIKYLIIIVTEIKATLKQKYKFFLFPTPREFQKIRPYSLSAS